MFQQSVAPVHANVSVPRQDSPGTTLEPVGTHVEQASGTLGFYLFILVNAVLLIRPSEIVPDLGELPLYEISILACLVASLPAVLELFRRDVLIEQPITVCVLGLLAAVFLSHVRHFMFGLTWDSCREFGKVVIYYLLLVANVSKAARLRQFLLWLVGFILVLAMLAVLQYHGWINIKALEALEQVEVNKATGEMYVVTRMRSTGIYNDPNDLCTILLVGIGISLYWLFGRGSILFRACWLAPLALFFYGLALTKSRGGLIGLMVGSLVLFRSRYGWGKTALFSVVVIPAILFLFGGRQTSFDLEDSDDSGQARIQLWSEGLELMRESPLLGIGYGEYAERVVHVAHNSFVHSFTELGLFGGTLFAGAFYCAFSAFYRLGRDPRPLRDGELQRLRVYLTAVVAAYAACLLSLSRAYVAPTYMILGTSTTYLSLAAAEGSRPLPKLNGRLVWKLVLVGVLTLAACYVIVRIFARYN